jgi:hypothetical protein
MRSRNHIVVFETPAARHKLCRVLFQNDGSYAVVCPYHTAREAVLFKATVNYSRKEQEVALEQTVDVAHSTDPDARIKLSHHASGLVQFSGPNVMSGVDEHGNIKGVGVQSWPLSQPVKGPAFVLTIWGVEHFEQAGALKKAVCKFTSDELHTAAQPAALVLEGHYFPSRWQRFIRRSEAGEPTIDIFHPGGAVLRLKALLPHATCMLQGFFGIELYWAYGQNDMAVPSLVFSSSTGNLRTNDEGEQLGDAVYCMYPRGDLKGRRSVDWPVPQSEQ